MFMLQIQLSKETYLLRGLGLQINTPTVKAPTSLVFSLILYYREHHLSSKLPHKLLIGLVLTLRSQLGSKH